MNVATEMIVTVTAIAIDSAYNNMIARQEADEQRAAYYSASKEITARFARMNTVALSHKFERTFNEIGCFNPFDATYEERYEMIGQLVHFELGIMFNGYRPSSSAKIMQQALYMALGMKTKQVGRFSEDQVRDIRIAYLMGDTSYRKLGKEFGVSGDMIRSICIGECYKDIHAEFIVA